MRTPSGAKLFSLSQFATPPTALPARRTFGSVADAQAHLEVSPLLCRHACLHAYQGHVTAGGHQAPATFLEMLCAQRVACQISRW